MSNGSEDKKRKGLRERVKQKGFALGMKLMNDPKRQQQLLRAMDTVQKGRAQLATLGGEVLHAYNLPSQKDIKTLGKRLSAIKKRVAEVQRRLSDMSPAR